MADNKYTQWCRAALRPYSEENHCYHPRSREIELYASAFELAPILSNDFLAFGNRRSGVIVGVALDRLAGCRLVSIDVPSTPGSNPPFWVSRVRV